MRLFDVDVAHEGPAQRRKRGLHVVPEERLGKGAVPGMSLALNTLLTRGEPVRRTGWLDLAAAGALAARVIERFRVKAAGAQATARSLSGESSMPCFFWSALPPPRCTRPPLSIAWPPMS